MKWLLAIIIAGIALVAYGPEPTIPTKEEDPHLGVQPVGRVTVLRIGVFADDLAYHDRRGITEVDRASRSGRTQS